MPAARHKTLPAVPPPDVPLDQTMAPVHFEGEIGLGIVWLWRKVRGLFSARHLKK
jgi:hypothetical protein